MLIDAKQKHELLKAVDEIRGFIENLESQSSCFTCLHFDSNSCNLAQGQTPPKEILQNGCPSWEVFDSIPY